MSQCDHCQLGDLHAGAFFSYGVEDGVALRADGQAVARIFDIASGVEVSLCCEQRTSDLKLRVGRIGLRRDGRGVDKES